MPEGKLVVSADSKTLLVFSDCRDEPVAIRRGPVPAGDHWDGEATFHLELPVTLEDGTYKTLKNHATYHQKIMLFQAANPPHSYRFCGEFVFVGERQQSAQPPLLAIRLQSVSHMNQMRTQTQIVKQQHAEAERSAQHVDVGALYALANSPSNPSGKRERPPNTKETEPPTKKSKKAKQQQEVKNNKTKNTNKNKTSPGKAKEPAGQKGKTVPKHQLIIHVTNKNAPKNANKKNKAHPNQEGKKQGSKPNPVPPAGAKQRSSGSSTPVRQGIDATWVIYAS